MAKQGDNYYRVALVTEVKNADTIKVAVDLGFEIVYQSYVKLAGIDSSEFRDKKNPARSDAVKKHLEENILNKTVTLKSLKDNSGKYLVFLYLEGQKESFNDQMVKAGLVKAFEKGDSK